MNEGGTMPDVPDDTEVQNEEGYTPEPDLPDEEVIA